MMPSNTLNAYFDDNPGLITDKVKNILNKFEEQNRYDCVFQDKEQTRKISFDQEKKTIEYLITNPTQKKSIVTHTTYNIINNLLIENNGNDNRGENNLSTNNLGKKREFKETRSKDYTRILTFLTKIQIDLRIN